MNADFALENRMRVSPIESLGQYQLTEVICRGGMATVYKAYQPSLDRHVAVKVLLQAQHPDVTTRFKREAWAIAHLQHPNIVPIYDYGEQDGILYLVLQYIENATTLDDMLGEPFELAAALRLMYRLLAVLNYAHRHGIIHRDLKPANIMMPSPSWPMLTDFGIAKLESQSERLTRAGMIIGTPAYIAPEQATGQQADGRTDLYATGVMLYEMLTGQLPFDGETVAVMLTKHVHEAPLPPRRVNPSLPPSVESFVLRALEKDPAERYQSAAEMAGQLQRIMLELPLPSSHYEGSSHERAGAQASRPGWCGPASPRQLVAVESGNAAGRQLCADAGDAAGHILPSQRHVDQAGRRQGALEIRPQLHSASAPRPGALPEQRASIPAARPIAQSVSNTAPRRHAPMRSAKRRSPFMSNYVLLMLALFLFLTLTNAVVVSDRSPISPGNTVRPTQPATPTARAAVDARGPLATSSTEAAPLSAPKPAPGAVLAPTATAVIPTPQPQPTETARAELPAVAEPAPQETPSDEADDMVVPTAEPAQEPPTAEAPTDAAPTAEPPQEPPVEAPTDAAPSAEPAPQEPPAEAPTDAAPSAEPAPQETPTAERPAAFFG
jgi:serine/threonine-protein kinase